MIDHQPRRLDATQREVLQCLALAAARALEGRAASRALLRVGQENEARLHRFYEATPAMLHSIDAQGRLVAVSDLWLHKLGHRREDVIGRPSIDFLTPDSQAYAREVVLPTFLATGACEQVAYGMLHHDGSVMDVLMSATLERDDQGRPLRSLAVIEDVSLRRRAERALAEQRQRLHVQQAALRKSEQFLDRTGRVAGVGGWELDLATGTITWSAETRRIHGVAADYRPVLSEAIDFYAPEARPVIQAAVERGMATGEGWDLELPLVRADGTPIWVRAVGAVEFEAGQAVRLSGAFQDITARRQLEMQLAATLEEVHDLYDNAPCGYHSLDADGRFLHINATALGWLGCSRDELIGKRRAVDFFSAEGQRQFAQNFGLLISEGHVEGLEFDLQALPGSAPRRVSVTAAAVRDADGRFLMSRSVMFDITARSAAERSARELTLTLHSVTEAIPATVAVVGTDGCYRFVNRAFERWSGRPRERIIGQQVRTILGDAEFERRWPWVQRAFAGEPVNFVLDYPSRDGGTHVALSYVPLRQDGGEVHGFVVVTQDVTRQKHEELRLLQLSQRDPLTGLLNRAGLEDHLRRALRQQPGASLALLYIDLDHFKPVNDRHGHGAGDEILQIFAKRLVNLVRPGDAVARLGGDEFAVALIAVREPANARAVAAKVVAAAQAPFQIGALSIRVGASVGVAFEAAPDPDTGWQGLVERADARLLSAKAAGRGRLASGEVALSA